MSPPAMTLSAPRAGFLMGTWKDLLTVGRSPCFRTPPRLIAAAGTVGATVAAGRAVAVGVPAAVGMAVGALVACGAAVACVPVVAVGSAACVACGAAVTAGRALVAVGCGVAVAVAPPQAEANRTVMPSVAARPRTHDLICAIE